MIGLLAAIVLLMPNSQEITAVNWYSTNEKPEALRGIAKIFAWQPQPAWGAVIACVFAISFVMIGSNSSFLYYQF